MHIIATILQNFSQNSPNSGNILDKNTSKVIYLKILKKIIQKKILLCLDLQKLFVFLS